MTAASTWKQSNMEAFLEALGGEAQRPCLLGAAEDSRLDQPDRVIWVPVETSYRVRECVQSYAGGVVVWEDSLAYDVLLRGMNQARVAELKTDLLNALVTLGKTPPAVVIEDGSSYPGSVAAEQGALLSIRIRVWEPVYYERRTQGHIETTVVGVTVTDQNDEAAGTL